jgi:hypothetical protein
MMSLTNRIIQDPTCVVEGDLQELAGAWNDIDQMLMEEESKSESPFGKDYRWTDQLRIAVNAITRYIDTLEGK